MSTSKELLVASQFVSCDLCGIDNASILLPHTASRLVRCNNCGLIYFNPQPTEKGLREYYSSESEGDYAEDMFGRWGELTSERMPSLLNELAFLETLLRSDLHKGPASKEQIRFLEIGCAFGYLLYAAKSIGWDAVGVDSCKPAADWACQNLSLRIIVGTLEDAVETLPKEGFDIVLMSHILEHTRSPRSTMQAVHHLLKPDGIVAVYVPNGDGIQARHGFSTWEWYHFPSHLYYYSPHTLSLLLKKIGFKVEKLWSIASLTGTDVELIKNRLRLDSIEQATRVAETLGPMCLGSDLRIIGRKVMETTSHNTP
jgi:2-polyprenyl-3-methyl-5-hydroxy-6-metoxy-1,4-benzoquinol methylase